MLMIFIFVTYALPSILSKLSYNYSMVLVNMLNTNIIALTKFTRSLSIDTQTMKHVQFFGWTYRRSQRHEINLSTIEFLKEFQMLIWKASNLLNHVFYWSLSIGFLNEFSVLIFNWFFFIQLFCQPPEGGFYSIVYIVSWTII